MGKLTITERKPKKVYTEENERQILEKLRSKYGHKKSLPHGYELQALLALSHYPELMNISIDFVFKETDLTLSAKPKPLSIFLPAKQRKYEIIISKKARSTKVPVMLKSLDFNIQVGVIGHELGHIADYMRKNSFTIIRYSVMYIIDSFKRKMERRTDKIAIKHGLGYQILGYAELVKELQVTYPQETYYQDYFKYYLSPSEIEEKMAKLKIYE
jgi:hypothetical protein